MPNCRRLLQLLLVFAVAGVATAVGVPPAGPGPAYLVHVWQTENGLPQNWVSSIAQTPDGYLWIGTRYGGLARFDGVRFVSFTPQNTRALNDIQVEYLSVDERGRLWVMMGNESVTMLQEDGFHLVRRPRAEPRVRPDQVLHAAADEVLFGSESSYLAQLNRTATANTWKIVEPPPGIAPVGHTFVLDRAATVWCLTQNRQLARFRNHRFETVMSGLPEPEVRALTADASRRILVATSRRVLSWVPEKGFVDVTPVDGPAPEGILQIASNGDGGLWVMENSRLRKCLHGHWVTDVTSPELLQPVAAGTLSLKGDSRGNLWLIQSGRGLWHVKADGSAALLTESTGLPSVLITAWFQDAEGDVWIGTAGGGVARIRESLFHALGRAEGLPGRVVNSVAVDREGTLWAGTMSGGLARCEDGRFVQVRLPSPDGQPTTSVTVFPGAKDELWLGSINHGLMHFQAGRITHPRTPWGTVRVLFGDSRDRLWVGGLVNLFCLDHGQISLFGSAEGFADSHAIGALAEDANGTLWIGTGPGDLWRYQAGRFTRFTPPAEWPSVRFSAVLPDAKGVVWIGTLGGGLMRFHDGTFTRWTKRNGLPDDNISQLLDSHDGHLWAGTYAGIFRAGKKDLEAVSAGHTDRVPVRVYGRFDGLPALECSSGFQPACWRAADGVLYFSTSNGVVSVNPREMKENKVPPTVIIEEMLVDGNELRLPPRSSGHAAGGVVQVGPGRHYVQFRFTGLNFAAPDGVRFLVRLEGGEGEWQNTAGQRMMGYGPLSPGTYRFHVIACNNDGVWNEHGDVLAFTVRPYFWQTWWFKTSLATAVLVALGSGIALGQRRRYRRELETVERQREVEYERARIARDLHDDLGTTLTQISMLSALANREQTPQAEARELVQQVRGCARSMVTALDEIVWAVNPKNDSWLELANYLGHFAEQFFRPTQIRCRLDIPERLPANPLSAERRHQVFLAFKEALNNAARHSGATDVRIRIEARSTEVLICVEDNGRGLGPSPVATRRQGSGRSNMRRRLQQSGGSMDWQETPSGGTTIVFHVPLETTERR